MRDSTSTTTPEKVHIIPNSPPVPAHPGDLRQVLRAFASGVTVVTATGPGGEPAGMTATAFTGVSLSPPTVLVCLDAEARTCEAIARAGVFAVNILAAGQEDLARRFATKEEAKFDGVTWRAGARGLPLLDGALGWIECTVARAIEAGTHVIYLGDVVGCATAEGEPLVYFDARYRHLSPA